MSKVYVFDLAKLPDKKPLEYLSKPFLSDFIIVVLGMPRSGKSAQLTQLFLRAGSPYYEHFNQALFVTRNIEDKEVERDIENSFGPNSYVPIESTKQFTMDDMVERLEPSRFGRCLMIFDDYIVNKSSRERDTGFLQEVASRRAHYLGEESNSSMCIIGHSKTSIPPSIYRLANQIFIYKNSAEEFKTISNAIIGMSPTIAGIVYENEYDKPYTFIILETGAGSKKSMYKALSTNGRLVITDLTSKYIDSPSKFIIRKEKLRIDALLSGSQKVREPSV